MQSPTGLPVWVLCAALAGCQTYTREPLDLKKHDQAWRARDLAGEEVRTFAERLARRRGEPAPFDLADGLSIVEAEAVALCFHPALREARARALVPLAGAREAGRFDDPQLGFDLLRILENADEPWVAALRLDFTLPLSGRLRAERERAWAEYDAAWRRIAVEEANVVAELRAGWLRWSAAAERLRRLRADEAAFERLEEVVVGLARGGELSPLVTRAAQIGRATLAADTMRAAAAETAGRLALHALLGIPADAAVTLNATLDGRAGSGPVQPLHAHPRIALARAEYEVAERSLREEVRKQYPDLSLGGLYEDDEGRSKLGLGLVVPLPILNANRAGIARARAERSAARAAAERAYEELAGRRARAVAAETAAAARRRFYVERLAPLAEEQVQELDRLLELGEADIGGLQEALTQASAIRLDILDATLEQALAQAQLAAIDHPLWAVEPEPEKEK